MIAETMMWKTVTTSMTPKEMMNDNFGKSLIFEQTASIYRFNQINCPGHNIRMY